MAYSADKKNRKKNLPAPYVNPWNELRKNIFAIFSDSQLRMREIFRRNLEGDLPCPDFWPSQLKQVFWPLVSFILVIVLILLSIYIAPQLSRSTIKVTSENNESIAENDLPASQRPFSQATSDNIILKDSKIFTNDESVKNKKLIFSWNQELFSLIQKSEIFNQYSKSILAGIDTTYKDNCIVVVVGQDWFDLESIERRDLAKRLIDYFAEFGYNNLFISTLKGVFLARNTRVGDGIVFLHSSF